MQCPQCGASVVESAKFCTECGAPLQPKPDFAKQTEYRIETFEQGPDPKPDPSQPLPVNASPAGDEPQPPIAAKQADARQSTAQQPDAKQAGGKKRSRSGCLIAAIVVLVAFVLLSVSCSMLDRCTSALSSPSNNTTATTTAGSTTTGASLTSAAVDSKDTWTVLFYLCGSDLESEGGLATFNLQELASTKLGDKVTFAIETGGSKYWQNSSIDPRYLTRYTISSDGFYEEQKLPSASMAVASTFADFVSWGLKTYPADHYMLVMWDHGGGSVYGVCNDELYPGASKYEADTLTLTEISEGLQQAGASFDVIGFDTCLMATYETAAMLSPYAEYLVASEEIEPGSGWDYVSWPQWLGAHTGATGAQLGAEICDSYYSKCKLYNAADMATLSVVDLSQISGLTDSFYDASCEIAQATGDRKALRKLRDAAYKTTCFGGDRSYNMVDLGDLMQKASKVVTEYYDDVVASVDDAVVYQVHGRSHPNVTGLSVFYPFDTSYKNEFYGFLDVAGNIPYAQFAAVMYGQYNAVDWDAYATAVKPKSAPVDEAGISIAYEERINDDGRLELQVTNGLDDIAQVSIELSLLLPEQNAVVYLGSDYNVKGDWVTGVFADNFYGKWMAIDGNWVSTMLYEIGDGYNMYYIPVLLNGQDSNLIARCDMNAGTYEIVCACAVVDNTTLAPKEMRALENGDVIEFQFGASTFDGQELTFELGRVVWNDDVKMEDIDLGEGVYLFRFMLTDVLGEEHPTDLYVQNYEGDTITVEPLADYLERTGFLL